MDIQKLKPKGIVVGSSSNPYEKLEDDPYNQLVTGQIPKTEELLTNAVTNANKKNPLPFFSMSDLPQVAFQGLQGPLANAPQNVIENPQTAAISGLPGTQFKAGAMLPTMIGSMFGGKAVNPEQEAEFLEPKSTGGKIAGIAANIIGGSVLPAKSLGRGITSLFGEKAARKGLEEVAYSGAKSAKDIMKRVLDEETTRFGRELDEIGGSMDYRTLANSLRQTAHRLGVGSIESHPLLKEARRIDELGGGLMSGRTIQAELKNIMSKLTDTVERSEFYRNVVESLPDSLRALKESYAPVFNVLEKGKKLTKTALKRAGQNMGESELSDLAEAEQTLDLNLLQKAIRSGKKISSTKTAKKVAGVALTGGAGLGGLAFLKSLLDK